jgi:hypothetical protein
LASACCCSCASFSAVFTAVLSDDRLCTSSECCARPPAALCQRARGLLLLAELSARSSQAALSNTTLPWCEKTQY